jgi:hypothetical protein
MRFYLRRMSILCNAKDIQLRDYDQSYWPPYSATWISIFSTAFTLAGCWLCILLIYRTANMYTSHRMVAGELLSFRRNNMNALSFLYSANVFKKGIGYFTGNLTWGTQVRTICVSTKSTAELDDSLGKFAQYGKSGCKTGLGPQFDIF